MSIQTRLTEEDSILTILISGRFDFNNLIEFRNSYSESNALPQSFIVNLQETTSIDSSALGMLLNMQRELKKADGAINIIRCNKDVMKVFQISQFDKKFKIS